MVKKVKKIKGLTIQFIPYGEIETLNSGKRVKKILDMVLNHKILILQGILKPEEEVRLIEDTMALVGHIKNFKGVELAVINPENKKSSMMRKLRHGFAKMLTGIENAITIIGPASIVKEMKKDPKKIELMLNK